MKTSRILLITILAFSLSGYCNAQIPNYPSGQTVSPGTFGNNINANTQSQSRNLQQQLIMDDYNIQAEIQRQSDILMLTRHGFPSLARNEGTSTFYDAFDEIKDMLNGTKDLSLGRAVFLAENAWHNNQYDYDNYRKSIKAGVDFCKQRIKEEKLDKNNNLVKNMMLFRYILDTLKIKDQAIGKTQIHIPIQYDYDDYQSQISYDSHFVTTLIRTGKGQCISMPLYYLVLAEEIGAEAYWAFSPRHSFVKIKDEKGNWYNLELTCKAILSDTHYMNSSYIKAEALQNKIYLEPLDKTNVVAEMLLELASGYYQKFGFDDFYLKCIDTAEQYLKNSLDAKLLRSSYQTRLTLTLAHLLDARNPEMMKELFPEAYRHYELMISQYKEIDDMGYEETPKAVYSLWLDYIAKEKKKVEETKQPSIFLNNSMHRQSW